MPITPAFLRGDPREQTATVEIPARRFYTYVVIAILIAPLLGAALYYFKARSVATPPVVTPPPSPVPLGFSFGVLMAVLGGALLLVLMLFADSWYRTTAIPFSVF